MSDGDLVRHLRRNDGDQDAWRTYSDRFYPMVEQCCRRVVDGRQISSKVDPEQIALEVLLKGHRHIRECKIKKPCSIRWWLRTTAIRDVLAEIDRVQPPPTHPGPRPGEEPPMDDLGTAVRWCVQRLPEKQRICIKLKWWRELKLREIAELLGISDDGVGTNIHHAKRNLRKCLRDNFPDLFA